MFIPGDLDKVIKSKTIDLTDLILQQQVDVSVNRTDSRIARSIEWLLANQRPNGAWGVNSVATTSLVMLAFANLIEPSGAWSLDEKVKDALDKAENFLLDRYQENRYENALWDTSVAVRALAKTGKKSQNFINERISWILGLSTQNVNAGPHHFAQKALVLAECGAQMQSIILAAEDCFDRVEKGRFKFSPYVLAQCLDALYVAQLDNKTKPLIEKLITFLETTHLDSANFINVCAALNALAPLKNFEIEKRMRLSVASLFGETCFRDNGTWYHDEMLTAYALIALTRFSKEVVIRAPKSEILYEINNVSDEIIAYCKEYSRQSWVWWLILVGNAFITGGLLTFFVTFTTLSNNMPEWLKWLIGTTIPITVGFGVQYGIRYYYKVTKKL